MAKLKVKNKDNTFSEVATKEYVDEKSGQFYTTEETLIGTWMGKNLYRKVVFFPRGLTHMTGEEQYYLGQDDDIDNIYIATGSYFTRYNRDRIPFPYYMSENASMWGPAYAWIVNHEGLGLYLNICLGHEALSFGECAIVLEYTRKAENNLITFSIGDWHYRAEKGMTWGEWVESEEYNIHYLTNYDIAIYADGSMCYYGFVKNSNGYVLPTDVINDNSFYSITETDPS